jgi:hypothetical protein
LIGGKLKKLCDINIIEVKILVGIIALKPFMGERKWLLCWLPAQIGAWGWSFANNMRLKAGECWPVAECRKRRRS